MTYCQVYEFYRGKRDAPCELTDGLICGGYVQKSGTGYLKKAEDSDLSNPSQWWHLMDYCLSKYEKHEEHKKYRFTPCGELLFWMAEVSGAVGRLELEQLRQTVLERPKDRKRGNNAIKRVCWQKIVDFIDSQQSSIEISDA